MKVLERAAGPRQRPVRRADNVDVEAVAVRTNNPVVRRLPRASAPTRPSSRWKACIDRLAEPVGISGWEIRDRNVVAPGDVWGPGQIMDDGCLGARACLDAVQARLRRGGRRRASRSGSGSG